MCFQIGHLFPPPTHDEELAHFEVLMNPAFHKITREDTPIPAGIAQLVW